MPTKRRRGGCVSAAVGNVRPRASTPTQVSKAMSRTPGTCGTGTSGGVGFCWAIVGFTKKMRSGKAPARTCRRHNMRESPFAAEWFVGDRLKKGGEVSCLMVLKGKHASQSGNLFCKE